MGVDRKLAVHRQNGAFDHRRRIDANNRDRRLRTPTSIVTVGVPGEHEAARISRWVAGRRYRVGTGATGDEPCTDFA